MKVTKQNAFNECGICVAHMLINYYGLKKITKDEVSSNVSLSPQGLSIKDLEDLLAIYDIQLDSYKLDWNELVNCHNNKPFILMLENENFRHYVIGQIKHNKITIYNPNNTIETYSLKEPIANFSGVVCFTNFKKNKLEKVDFKKTNIFANSFNLFSLTLVLINIIEFALELVVSFYSTRIMNINPLMLSIDSLWKISIIFGLLLVVHYGFNLFNYLIKTWRFKDIYRSGVKSFFDVLLLKNIYFYHSYNKFEILQNVGNIPRILRFNTFYLSELFSDIFIFLASSIVLIFLNKWYGLVTLINLIIMLIVNFFTYRNNKNLVKKTWNDQYKIEAKINSFFEYSKVSKNFDFQKTWSDKIQFDLFNLNNIHLYFAYKNKIVSFWTDLVLHLLNYIILLLSWSLSFDKPGQIFLAFTIFTINSSSISKLSSTIFEYFNIKPIYDKMTALLASNNLFINKDGVELKEISSLSINSIEIKKNVVVNYHSISEWKYLDYLIKQKSYDGTLKINNTNLEKLDAINYHQALMLINNQSVDFNLNLKDIITFLPNEISEKIREILCKYNLNPYYQEIKSLPKEIKGIFVLLSLLQAKNKLIILDNVLDEVSNDYKDLIYQLFEKINLNNFIISNSKNNSFLEIYDYQL